MDVDMVWCGVALATDDYRVIIFEVRDLCGLCPSTCHVEIACRIQHKTRSTIEHFSPNR